MNPSYKFIIAESENHFAAAGNLFKEYASWLNIDLSFQNFDRELAEINVQYNLPSGGLILIQLDENFIGCAGIRKIDEKIAELKRMYIQPAHQGRGLGKQLMEKAMAVAVERGYNAMRLDTMKSLTSALHLYRQFGFNEIEAYRFNPSPDVLFFEKIIA